MTKDDNTNADPDSEVEVEVTETEADSEVEADPTEDPTEPTAPVARRSRGAKRLLAPIAAAVVTIASLSTAGYLYFFQYRADQAVDPAATQAALDAAKDGTIALLSYAPETLDDDLATAKTRLTGDFLSYYTDFTDKVVAPAARQKSVKTTATVAQAAMSEMNPESAVALLFINQATTSQENPDGAFASSSIKVGLTKVGDDWLISSFDPV
ncbi:twin-arginine translocation pathway signal [Mycobacterium sp. 852013-51886_SCH5428379]|uniref:twin-arginine translocation pathway signal n=1 Tax=Mycobacterium sp. 852013-51886_SCH5428379 TaxID=1834111 RepID=UPI0007FFEE4C|nr:twin-arginine translocation pathway signal [Mycobacterium sp. 852013-51886_SCH5428379]OBB55985.1 twin-arginine translocation pathway signal [Mycobacterium sp. 852013-51886_SCH5428379]